MKRNVLFLSFILFFLSTLLIGTAIVLNAGVSADPSAVNAANQLYAAGHYAEAAQIYEQEIARGVQNSALFYNLGNTYYQQGDLGRAVLNMERAAQLNPRDADIRANLELVRGQTVAFFAGETNGPVTSLAGITSWLTLNETAVLVLGFWFLLGFLLLVRRSISSEKPRKMAQWTAVLVLVLLILFGVSLASRSFLERTQPEGVVVAPTVAVSSEPGMEFATDLNLSGGMAFNLLEQQGDWIRLGMPEGSPASWVPMKAVEPVAVKAADAV